jgi:outer membrane biosynthesis protein TonB
VGLTDDQKAMLRLLAQREEGYDDMAALMGISVEEVRERVKEALAEVEEPAVSEGEPAPEPPPPPVPVPATPEPPASVEPPKAMIDEPVVPPGPTPKARPAKRATRIPSLKVPKDRGALIGLGAGALVVVILVIVLIVGGDGGGSSSATTSSESALAEKAAAPAQNENLTQAVLSPTDGGNASGRAVFGRFKKKVLLQVTAEGLEPSQQGETYTVWLYRSPKIALQIGSVPVDQSGKLAAQFEIPVQLLTYVANGAFDQIDVARTATAEYKAAFAKAKKESRVPPYVGESVLRGKITSPAIENQ